MSNGQGSPGRRLSFRYDLQCLNLINEYDTFGSRHFFPTDVIISQSFIVTHVNFVLVILAEYIVQLLVSIC